MHGFCAGFEEECGPFVRALSPADYEKTFVFGVAEVDEGGGVLVTTGRKFGCQFARVVGEVFETRREHDALRGDGFAGSGGGDETVGQAGDVIRIRLTS